MPKLDDILKELLTLLEKGLKLQIGKGQNEDLGTLAMRYEAWYTQASAAISQIMPERIQDFRDAYRLQKRKEITYETYTISDYLLGLRVSRHGQSIIDADNAYSLKLIRQLALVKAAIELAPSSLRDIRTVLQSELLDSDLDAARMLLRARHLRSAGVVCGVVIEAHLKTVADRHNISFRKTKLTISDLNDTLKDKAVYDVPTWRLIQRLADIRNLCGHAGEREPKSDDIEDLIEKTEKILKEVF
ncbi:MAG TPA: hypothetical protein VGE04_02130 [Chloroflexia bacterium]|jgi:hypothetical protein